MSGRRQPLNFLASNDGHDVFNAGKLDAVDTYIDPAYIRHDPGLPFAVAGPEGIRQLVTAYRTAFPDIPLACQAIVADGDRVAAHWAVSGTSVHYQHPIDLRWV